MTQAVPHSLDVLTLPLFGARLIEASAGTGKTYTLAGLYLRLLLGLGGEAAHAKPLLVEEILVVTFTEAATEELRERIRSNIHALRLACLRGNSQDALLAALMGQIPDLALAAETLLDAEQQMDEAAIYTIHGFCQRMLGSYAFESGTLFDQTLIEDEQPLNKQACADFWRRYCYPLPMNLAQVISQLWRGPEALLSELTPYLHGEIPQLRFPPQPGETLLSRHQQILSQIDSVKQHWQQVASQVETWIADSDVDKRSYSSRYLPDWVQSVTAWSEQDTDDYQLPKALEKFGQDTLNQKTKKGTPPQHPLFAAIDGLLSASLTVRDIVMVQALQAIRAAVRSEKLHRAALGFDDLLARLDEALQQPQGEALAAALRQRHPVAMIDEFQDTDPQQYRIFRAIYGQQNDSGMLLIGDPKQAIYAFRGADIFTYMRARADVAAHYTLDTNWRSSPAMVESVNRLFQRVENPFIFNQIPFLPVNPAAAKRDLSFEVEGAEQAAVEFRFSGDALVATGEYQQMMAQQCAMQIRDWLQASQRGAAWLVSGASRRSVQAADICILVRNRHEAGLVREALRRLAIPAVYLSNRDSVFTTPEAHDVLWILQAVLAPEQEKTLRSALATALLGMNAAQIDALNQDEAAWDHSVEDFAALRQLWRRRGVLPMLRALMARYRLAENLLASRDGERRLTDFLHLGELLQHASGSLESEHALVRWLSQQILQPNPQAENQQLRLESDRHLVQIVTIHKSKGLEYPLVWLPFICHFRPQPEGIYHDRQQYQPLLDLTNSEESQQLAEEERLAEDLRLLYVALTRSIYHCSVGVAPLQRTRRKSESSDMHRNALGYLLQQGEESDGVGLAMALDGMKGAGIAVTPITAWDGIVWQPDTSAAPELHASVCERSLSDSWRVTSYSGLQQHGSSAAQELLPHLDIDARVAGDNAPLTDDVEPRLTPHTFPKGAGPGTFLHGLFETLDFNQPVDLQALEHHLTTQGMATQWAPMLQSWFTALLNAPLQTATSSQAVPLTLARLPVQQRLAELGFYLPISAPLQAEALDRLAKRHDPLSASCPPLQFQHVKGMLKGFIDLVFCWQGRYYVLDYKSNWLGDDASAYTPAAMQAAMAEHRYDLQYQLYTLALHRYLRHRIADYDYQRHVGGVIYLFLRGVDPALPGNGLFSCCPTGEFIDALDRLFQGDNTLAGETL